MKQWLKQIDPGLGVVAAICLVAIWPFISRLGLPQGTDAELHVYRLLELGHLIRGGEIYPRWAPDFYHGYGYPIFNYYAPLTYYLGLVVDLMPRLGPIAGVKAVFVLGIVCGAVGVYGFVRDNWGKSAGYVASAVFVYAPYIQYVDPWARGALAESFSFGVFPLALWALDRLRREGGRWNWITAVFATAAVILSHNLMGLFLFGLLFAWAIWQLAIAKHLPPAKSNLFLLALFVGVGLSAFFWLPVILERNAVNLNTLIGAGDNYDFHTHFLSWRELLAFSPWLDWGASEPDFRFNLGVVQWVFGAVGIIVLLIGKVKQQTIGLFFALALAGVLFLMLPTSTKVWESIPFLPFFQFPWRLLGAAAVLLAILAGVGVSALRLPPVATAVFVALPLLVGLPMSQIPQWPDFGPATLASMSDIEWHGRWLGTTSTADYVPVTVDSLPERNGQVVSGLYNNHPLDRVNRVAMPDGAQVVAEEIRPLFTRYYVSAPKQFRLRLYQFDFPGWQVRIDGEPVETELARPEGFIVILVPQGEHVVEVEFGNTPARTWAWVVSGLSFIGVLGIGYWVLGNKVGLPTQRENTVVEQYVLGAVWGITAVHLLVLQPMGWLHYYSSGKTAEPASFHVFADYGQQIALIGYDASAQNLRPGDSLTVRLYWQAQQPLDINYQVFTHVLSADGVLVAQSDKLNPGAFPTRRWPLDKYVRDEHIITLPADLPPGLYTVAVGLWVQSEGWRLPLLDETGQQIGDNYDLFELTVEP